MQFDMLAGLTPAQDPIVNCHGVIVEDHDENPSIERLRVGKWPMPHMAWGAEIRVVRTPAGWVSAGCCFVGASGYLSPLRVRDVHPTREDAIAHEARYIARLVGSPTAFPMGDDRAQQYRAILEWVEAFIPASERAVRA